MKKCPFCAEDILAAAIRCKHCQADLAGGMQASRPKSGSEALGIVMLVTPLLSTALIWLWVGQMNLLQGPLASLQAISVITIIATALLGSIEASHLGAGAATDLDRKGTKRSGPMAWFFTTCLLWIFGFPAWLYTRSKYGLKNMLVGAIVVTVVFVGSLVMMSTAIDGQIQRARTLMYVPRS